MLQFHTSQAQITLKPTSTGPGITGNTCGCLRRVGAARLQGMDWGEKAGKTIATTCRTWCSPPACKLKSFEPSGTTLR
jgi:hypothetical protein